MKVIMLKDVGGVGQIGTIQEVSDGYALNNLIPRGLAEQATADKLAAHKQKTAQAAKESEAKDKEYADLTRRVESASIEIVARANEQGHLYEQLPVGLVQSELEKRVGAKLPSDAITFDKTIREVGEWDGRVRLGEYSAHFKVHVKGAK